MEIKIKDFNIIKNIDLTLEPGFTVIQGPSNSGKSSIIKAIENCIFNQSGTVNVRHGCKNYSVGIKKGDHTVALIKGKDTKYKVDDVVYEKIGVSQLAEVAETLNIRETVLGGEKVRLNFSKQMSYPFLLDKTPGQLYRFIVDSSESESLSNVLKDISKDIKDIDKSIIQNDARIDVLTKQQAQLNENLKDSDHILEVSNRIIEMDSEYQKIERLSKYSQSFSSITSDISNLKGQIASYNIDIDLNSLTQLKERYVNYTSIFDSYNKTKGARDLLLNKIDIYSVSIDLSRLDTQFSDLSKVNQLLSSYNSIVDEVNYFRNQISDFDERIKIEKDKLSEFKVCPLCGNSIEDHN